MLDIASHQDFKHSFLLFGIYKLISRDNDRHSRIAVRGQSNASIWVSLRLRLQEIRRRVCIETTDSAQDADVVHDLLIGSFDRRST
jgi:hypothetical protein